LRQIWYRSFDDKNDNDISTISRADIEIIN
jgi:hypothetical protein